MKKILELNTESVTVFCAGSVVVNFCREGRKLEKFDISKNCKQNPTLGTFYGVLEEREEVADHDGLVN